MKIVAKTSKALGLSPATKNPSRKNENTLLDVLFSAPIFLAFNVKVS